MSPSVRDFLMHISDETTYLLSSSNGLDFEKFVENDDLKRAYCRSLEIIGEAVKQIPDEMCQRYSRVDWRLMAKMRDKLIHKYFGVDYDIVWSVVMTKMPILDAEVKRMLREEF